MASIDYTLKPSIYVKDSSNVYFDQITISDYANVERGAAMFIDNSNIEIKSTVISNNHASIASLNIINLSNVTVTDTNFTGNEAVQAACLYISDASVVTSSNCRFTGNKATTSGVFTILLSGMLLDTGSTMTGNEATRENSVGLFTGRFSFNRRLLYSKNVTNLELLCLHNLIDSTGSVFDGTVITDNTMAVGTSK